MSEVVQVPSPFSIAAVVDHRRLQASVMNVLSSFISYGLRPWSFMYELQCWPIAGYELQPLTIAVN